MDPALFNQVLARLGAFRPPPAGPPPGLYQPQPGLSLAGRFSGAFNPPPMPPPGPFAGLLAGGQQAPMTNAPAQPNWPQFGHAQPYQPPTGQWGWQAQPRQQTLDQRGWSQQPQDNTLDPSFRHAMGQQPNPLLLALLAQRFQQRAAPAQDNSLDPGFRDAMRPPGPQVNALAQLLAAQFARQPRGRNPLAS